MWLRLVTGFSEHIIFRRASLTSAMRIPYAPPWPPSSGNRSSRKKHGASPTHSLPRPGALLSALFMVLLLHPACTLGADADADKQRSSGALVSPQRQQDPAVQPREQLGIQANASAPTPSRKAAEKRGQEQGQGQGDGQGKGKGRKEETSGPLHGRVNQFQKELVVSLLNRLPLLTKRKAPGTPPGSTGSTGQHQAQGVRVVLDSAMLLTALQKSGAKLISHLRTAALSSWKAHQSSLTAFLGGQRGSSLSGKSEKSGPEEKETATSEEKQEKNEQDTHTNELKQEETEGAVSPSERSQQIPTSLVQEPTEASGQDPKEGAESAEVTEGSEGKVAGEHPDQIPGASVASFQGDKGDPAPDTSSTATLGTGVAPDGASTAPERTDTGRKQESSAAADGDNTVSGESSTAQGAGGVSSSTPPATAGAEPGVPEDKGGAAAGVAGLTGTESTESLQGTESTQSLQGTESTQSLQVAARKGGRSEGLAHPQGQSQLRSPGQAQEKAKIGSHAKPQKRPGLRVLSQAERQAREDKFAKLRAQALAKVPRPSKPELDLALTFIKENIQFPGRKQCGAWSTSYAQLQKEIRSGQRRPAKYIFYAGQDGQGMGDRLLGLVTTFAVGLLSNRALVVQDDVLATAFDPAVIDWRMGPDFVAAREKLQHTIEVESPDKEPKNRTYEGVGKAYVRFSLKNGSPLYRRSRKYRFAAATSFVRFPRKTIYEYFLPFQEAPIIELCTNAGVLTQALAARQTTTAKMLKNMGMRLQTAYPCILRFLLRPVPQVWQPLAPVLVQLQAHRNYPTFCVHMRVTDSESWDPSGMPVVDRVFRRSWKLLDHLLK